VIQACCKPVLQSSSEQWALHFAMDSAAVHWWRVTEHPSEKGSAHQWRISAHLHQELKVASETELTQGCCQDALQSNSTPTIISSVLRRGAVH